MHQPNVTVSSLSYCPVKSCGQVGLTRITVGPAGFIGDRADVLVKEGSNNMLSQRDERRLALVRPQIRNGQLWLTGEGQQDLMVPQQFIDGTAHSIDIFGRVLYGIDRGDVFSQWFKAFGITTPCRMISIPPGNHSKRVLAGGQVMPVGGHDSSPVNFLSEASVVDLIGRVNANNDSDAVVNFGPHQFRPNIVLSGCPAYFEEKVFGLKIGRVVFHFRKRTERCKIIEIDQKTAEDIPNLLRTLCAFHMHDKKPTLGVHFYPITVGEIKVGDKVEIIHS